MKEKHNFEGIKMIQAHLLLLKGLIDEEEYGSIIFSEDFNGIGMKDHVNLCRIAILIELLKEVGRK